MAHVPPVSARSAGTRFLDGVERIGNKLPHPVWLFVIMAALLALTSWLLATLRLEATMPDGEIAPVKNLISREGLQFAITSVVDNFMAFPPLGVALVALLALGVADRAGLIRALLIFSLSRVSPRVVTPVLAFTGSFAHIAGDAGYIILLPLAGMIFRAMGRNPITGTVVALAALSGGSSASPVLIPNDAIFAGLTTAAAQTIDPNYAMSPVGNIYFTIVSSFVITATITLVVDGYLAKRVDRRLPVLDSGDATSVELEQVTPIQRAGLKWTGIVTAAYILLLVLITIPQQSPIRGESGGLLDSLLVSDVVVFLAILFLLVGTTYGIRVGAITNSAAIPRLAAEGLKDVTPILVLFFVISQFLAYFNWTNIGVLIATNGAQLLRSLNAHDLAIFGGMLVIVALMNLFITSGSAQWALISPIFVPMLMLLDIPPETTTALYRLGDSPTGILTPMSPYFALTVTLIQRYRKDAGIGSLFSMTLPLAAAIMLAWIMLFLVWYLAGWPLGPGAPIR